MLITELAIWFTTHGWTWKVKDGPAIVPTEDDIEAVLDEAAASLYNEQPGSRFETGRLIIEKKHHGHDVYVFAGTYE